MRSAPLLALLVLALVAPRAEAQCTGTPGTDFQIVTVRQINTIPQANIDFLNANAATLTPAQLNANLTPALNQQQVQFTAVVLTDPYNSGNASITGGVPNRVHVFVRDVTTVTDGVAGMGMQLVDGSGNGQILLPLIGDEIVVCGIVSPFISTANGSVQMQVSPNSVTVTGNTFAADAPIRQPVVVTTDDIHDVVNGLTQIDWDRYTDFNSQFVRLETTTLVQGVPAATGRPDMLFQSVGSQTQLNSGTISLRFRNDRSAGANTYPNPPYNTRPADQPFTPPATGVVNVQGFLTYAGYDGPFDYTSPANTNWVVNPFADEDFVIAVAPPIVVVNPLTVAPTSATAATITATVTAGTAGNTVASVVLNYQIVGGASGQVTMTNTGGDTYSAQIPAAASGQFVTYTITATDNQGAAFTTPQRSFRVLDGPITSISLVQTTASGQPGASPFYFGTGNNPGPAVAFNLNAVVQSVFQSGSSFYGILQDDAGLQPWTGVWAFFGSTAPALAVGDRIAITEAAINERFDVTQLQDIVFSVTSAGAPYDHKVVTTDLFAGTAGRPTAEAHEGMLLRFNNVTITNPNAGNGEWAFTTGAPADALLADDLAEEISPTFNVDNLVLGQTRDFQRGAMYFSFGAYKLVPTNLSDVGTATGIANEPGVNLGAARIAGAFPNPTTGTARVRFELDRPGAARLALVDALGREVAVLADGTYSADVHDVALDARGLAAGVYVLRLTAADAVATARLSVVR